MRRKYLDTVRSTHYGGHRLAVTIPRTISENAKLHSTSALATLLGVHRSTIWNWIQSGLLRAERTGPKAQFWAIRDAELKRFMAIYKRPAEDQ